MAKKLSFAGEDDLEAEPAVLRKIGKDPTGACAVVLSSTLIAL